MKNLKVSVRLASGFGIILILLIISTILSLVNLRSIAVNLDTFFNRPFRNVALAIRADMDSEVAAKYMLQACMETDKDKTEEMLSKCNEYLTSMQNNLNMLKESYSGDLADITTVEDELKNLETYYNQYSAMARINDSVSAYQIYTGYIVNLLTDITTSIGNITDYSSQHAAMSHNSSLSSSSYSALVVIILGVSAIIAGFVIAVLITRSIKNPIAELKEATEKMRLGDFSAEIKYRSKDELGVLSDSLRSLMHTLKDVIQDISFQTGELANGNLAVKSNAGEYYVGDLEPIFDSILKMKAQLNSTMSGINTASEEVDSGALHVSSAAQALAQGATQQASSIEALADNIANISRQVTVTAEHAKTARDENENSHRQIEICSGYMDQLMEAMNAIDSKSSEIGKVIKTIEDIAFQTNILALNAAVEAARAGDAGKGFAVVADEVRNLATKSQDASKSTSTLIEETINAVSEGSRLSVETNNALKNVIESANRVLESVTLISDATAKQSDAVTMITNGIDQISSVVQTNSATAQETAAASEELSGQSHELESLVSIFSLDM